MNINLPGEVMTKKNNQIAIRRGDNCLIIPNNKYQSYEREKVKHLKGLKWEGEYPVIVEFFFYRKTKRKFDFDNLQSAVLDVLVKAGVIEDDSMNHVIPKIHRHGWEVDKENPRVIINIYAPELVE